MTDGFRTIEPKNNPSLQMHRTLRLADKELGKTFRAER
jgi:hypothetical protein